MIRDSVIRDSVSHSRDLTTEEQLGHAEQRGLDMMDGIFWVAPEERFDELRPLASVGRAEDCSFRLSGSGVSRLHCRIEKEGPLWLLRDLESRNGTFVNGQNRALSPLCLQDTIRVGDWVGVACRVPRSLEPRGALFESLSPDLILSAPTAHRLSSLSSLAKSDLSIILQGETGTGKEVLARAIHQLSGRSGALVAINCAAIPEALLEAELFGHKKGAFTGAVDAGKGHVASAAQGTLFLDEIVELPLSLQSKLLRVLEERTVTPVGDTRAIKVDFRLIASSQEPLEGLVAAGELRADLYARLNGAELSLPPLRQRRQEVVRLLRHAMAAKYATPPHLESRLVERLCGYEWPYNVRELCQLGRLLCASGQPSFGLKDLPQRFLDAPQTAAESTPGPVAQSLTPTRRKSWLSRHAGELDRLKQALHACNGNVSEAARAAGIPRHRARRLLAAAAGPA